MLHSCPETPKLWSQGLGFRVLRCQLWFEGWIPLTSKWHKFLAELFFCRFLLVVGDLEELKRRFERNRGSDFQTWKPSFQTCVVSILKNIVWNVCVGCGPLPVTVINQCLFIGIPYWKCDNPGGYCWSEGATPDVCVITVDLLVENFRVGSW